MRDTRDKHTRDKRVRDEALFSKDRARSFRRRLGIVAVVAGTLCCIAAALLVSVNAYEDTRAQQTSNALLEHLYADINDPFYVSGDNAGDLIDGRRYAGYLEIPCLELTLPVLAEWNFNDLQLAPCCYAGKPGESGSVIAAHNYTSHFGRLAELRKRDRIVFTGVNGVRHEYEVKETEEVFPSESALVVGSSWDITLFTCNYNGTKRFVVRGMAV